MCLGDDLVLSGAYTNTIPRRAAPGPQVRLQGEPLPQAPTLTKLRPSGVDDGVCVRGPQDQPQVNGSFSGFTGLSMQSQSWPWSITTKQDQQRQKGGRSRVWKKPSPRFGGPLSVESRRMAPAATGPGNAAHQGSRGVRLRLGVQGICRRLSHVGTVGLAPAKITNAKKGKAGVPHKPHCHYKQFRHGEPL